MSVGTVSSLGTLRAPGALFILLTVALVTPAAAQSKAQRQMMADLRMLQEQNQTLQNVLGSIAEAIKAVNTRLDDQVKVTGKAMADEKLIIGNLANTVREIREKLDDNNVRLGSLNQEVEALRQGLQQLNARPAVPDTATLETALRALGALGPLTPAWRPRSPCRRPASYSGRRRRSCMTRRTRTTRSPNGISPSPDSRP